jgi:hypothetical protein
MGYLDDERLRGVGGWLAFLCVIFLFLSPARTVITTWMDIGSAEQEMPALAGIAAWQSLKLYAWSIAVLASGLSIYAGWQLNMVHRPSSVRLAIAMLWGLGPGLVLIDSAILSVAFGVPLMVDPEMTRELARTFVAAGLWTAYLLLSRRVKNTYYADDDGNYPKEGPVYPQQDLAAP